MKALLDKGMKAQIDQLKVTKQQIKALRSQAKLGQKQSYSPYSKFRVGSSILTKKGNIFSGCNIENASYGATVCAERVAVWKAQSSGDHSPIVAIYVVVNADQAWPPCGLCRQVLAEFAQPDAWIYCEGNKSNQVTSYRFSEIMPHAFGPQKLVPQRGDELMRAGH